MVSENSETFVLYWTCYETFYFQRCFRSATNIRDDAQVLIVTIRGMT